MCGIIGAVDLKTGLPAVELTSLRQMLAMIRHRGPDEFGVYQGTGAALGSARLSIIDLSTGSQPIGNEDGSRWIVFNGEIFNYVELRPELDARGHDFSTHADTEVILHLYEDYGPACLNRLNGQFVFAIWDENDHSLFLARDRVGVRPLFYTIQDGRLIFGSEIKAILAFPGVQAAVDSQSLSQIFTYWAPLTPRTPFEGIFEVPPGHYLTVKNGQVKLDRYWELNFAEEQPERGPYELLEEFEALMIDATRIRLRADVPVGAYLSGGLDSSTTTAIIRKYTDTPLDTFSITFSDPGFDESSYQHQMAEALGVTHHEVYCTHEDIGRIFPEVIWHTEFPILRTAPAPMFLLSGLVRDHHYKVVLTGEGADEFLGGYDIFKEAKIRRFWARDTESKLRPRLLGKLYPDINLSNVQFLAGFFRKDLTETTSPFYSHRIRWNNTARTRRFLLGQEDWLADGSKVDPELKLPPDFAHWSSLAQAQYLEITTFLSPYLLSSQGDRMGMAHSVEGRFPFLDYRVMEFANRLPADVKLMGLTEKWLLKKLGQKLVPETIWKRVKRPYRAPIHHSFFTETPPAYVPELLSESALRRSELFEPRAVSKLVQKAQSGANLTEVEDMALVGVLSTQLVNHQFVEHFPRADGDVTLPNFKHVNRQVVL